MLVEQPEGVVLEALVAAGEEGGAGEAGGAQVAEDALGRPGASDGKAVFGHLAERGVGEVVQAGTGRLGVRTAGARAPVSGPR